MMAEDSRRRRGGVDSFSSLPDEILQHILSFTPTKVAVKTSLLSKRWRHVWCGTPSLSFDGLSADSSWEDKAQNRYTAPKMMNFHVRATDFGHVHSINQWINFALSRNVENMSLEFKYSVHLTQLFFCNVFFASSSIKKLSIKLEYMDMPPRWNVVSWTSLKNLSVHSSALSDESIAKILSGCPVLETLTLSWCHKLKVLDLTKSLLLRTLEVNREFWVSKPLQIVAPHIHCLRLINSQLPCTLVDVSSLAEAKLNVFFEDVTPYSEVSSTRPKGDDTHEVMIRKLLEMLEKSQNVEKLTFGGDFLQMLSLAELRGLSFPMFKVKVLTLETSLFQFVMPPGIERLLLNSPDLKKLIIRTRTSDTKTGEYLDLLGTKDGVHWDESRWSAETNHVASS